MMNAQVHGFTASSENSSAFSREYMEKHFKKCSWELNHGILRYSPIGEHGFEHPSRKIVSVEQRRGTNILILRCEPEVLFFLRFDTKKQADEWEEEICKVIDQEYDRPLGFRRVRTDIKSRRYKPKLTKTVSSPPDTPENGGECTRTSGHLGTQIKKAVNGGDEEETRNQSTSSLRSPSVDSPTSLKSTISFQSELSPTGSLKSIESVRYRHSQFFGDDLADTTEGRVFDKEQLMGTVLVNYKGQVRVKSTLPKYGLHVGDQILAIDSNSNLKDARAMVEHIITKKDYERIYLRIFPGIKYAISSQGSSFMMSVKGSKESMHKVLAFTPTAHGKDTLEVTDAINYPEETNVTKEVVDGKFEDILQEAPGFTLINLVPSRLLQELSELKGICIRQEGLDIDHCDMENSACGHSSSEARATTSTSPDGDHVIRRIHDSSSSPSRHEKQSRRGGGIYENVNIE